MSSSGEEIAARAASDARSGPEARPTATKPRPAPEMTARKSAKSTLISCEEERREATPRIAWLIGNQFVDSFIQERREATPRIACRSTSSAAYSVSVTY